MMSLNAQVEADLARLFDSREFGQAATYHPLVGAPVGAVVFVQAMDMLTDDAVGVNPAGVAQLAVRASQVPSPRVRERFVVDGQDWLVTEIIRREGGVWTLAVTASARVGT